VGPSDITDCPFEEKDPKKEGIRELETPVVIDAINTGGKHRSTCPRQPPVILEFAVTDDNEQGLNKTLGQINYQEF